ncbi:MAG: AraC family transcriptional regulator [Desulfovibrionaceae bacterium]|jgi:AraC-like DNA-binding protein|nr:AraC family transcriptional regulator [Desulfovibrionaceae bacterium]
MGDVVLRERVEGAPGVTVVCGRVCGAVFARHAHRCFVVGAVESGARRLGLGGGEVVAGRGVLFLLNPRQPHSCVVEAGEAHGYGVLSVPAERMEALAARVWGVDAARVRFDRAVVEDADLAVRVAALAHALTAPGPGRGVADAVGELDAVLGAVIARHGRPLPGPEPEAHPAARRARGAIDAAVAREAREARETREADGAAIGVEDREERLTLEALARLAHASPFHLQRIFSREYGVSPRRYQEQERVRAALELLERGVPIGRAALEAGFADQSHLTRVFRGLMGVPPGRFLRGAGRGE